MKLETNLQGVGICSSIVSILIQRAAVFERNIDWWRQQEAEAEAEEEEEEELDKNASKVAKWGRRETGSSLLTYCTNVNKSPTKCDYYFKQQIREILEKIPQDSWDSAHSQSGGGSDVTRGSRGRLKGEGAAPLRGGRGLAPHSAYSRRLVILVYFLRNLATLAPPCFWLLLRKPSHLTLGFREIIRITKEPQTTSPFT